MKVVVTGGYGFIGSNFVKYLINSNLAEFDITILDNLSYSANKKNLLGYEDKYKFVNGDIRNLETVLRITKNVEYIFNFAAESHVDRSILRPSDFFTTNILGAANIFEAALKNEVFKVIQISTDEVYGSILNGSADENAPLNPSSPYSASKVSADLLANSYRETYGLNYCITRSSNNYGPHQFPEKLIPLFVTNLLKGKKIPLYGNGQNIRNWIYVEDNCEAILKVAIQGRSGEIYNIGTKNEFSNLDIAKYILQILNLEESFIDFVEDRPGHDFRYSLNSGKIETELQFSAHTDFLTGLRKTIEWYKKNIN